jgi:hypothetical protein
MTAKYVDGGAVTFQIDDIGGGKAHMKVVFDGDY